IRFTQVSVGSSPTFGTQVQEAAASWLARHAVHNPRVHGCEAEQRSTRRLVGRTDDCCSYFGRVLLGRLQAALTAATRRADPQAFLAEAASNVITAPSISFALFATASSPPLHRCRFIAASNKRCKALGVDAGVFAQCWQRPARKRGQLDR